MVKLPLMRKKLTSLLVYISILFLFLYLYKLDYFAFKEVAISWIPLLSSTLLLWIGFVLSCVSWWNILDKHKIKIRIKQGIVSQGMAIFAKYIPGKIWVILGRAGYITQYGHSLKTTSFLSLKEQLIYLWLGLLISAVPMIFLYGINEYTAIVLILCLFLTFLLFSSFFHNWFLKGFRKITKKELDVPHLNFRESLPIILYVFYYWAVWLMAFYLFVASFFDDTSIQMAFAFPLSVTIGVLAIIFPGGTWCKRKYYGRISCNGRNPTSCCHGDHPLCPHLVFIGRGFYFPDGTFLKSNRERSKNREMIIYLRFHYPVCPSTLQKVRIAIP